MDAIWWTKSAEGGSRGGGPSRAVEGTTYAPHLRLRSSPAEPQHHCVCRQHMQNVDHRVPHTMPKQALSWMYALTAFEVRMRQEANKTHMMVRSQETHKVLSIVSKGTGSQRWQRCRPAMLTGRATKGWTERVPQAPMVQVRWSSTRSPTGSKGILYSAGCLVSGMTGPPRDNL